MARKDIFLYFARILSSTLLVVICTTDACSQSQITFRQLSIKEGLSQNSAVSISQDSTGYLWIATQDGLNRYDGKKFIYFPYSFVDITKPDYSNLGKVYTDRKGELWIIPLDRIPRKLLPETQTFEPVPGIDDASVIYQDKNFNLWFGTYSNGLYSLKKDSEYVKQEILPSNLNGTIFNIVEDSSGDLLLASEHSIISFNSHTGKHNNLNPESLANGSIEANFSDIVFDKKGRQWIATYGDGLYLKEKNGNHFNRISKFSFSDPLPNDLNILDLYLDSKDRIWVATYGRGMYMINLSTQKINHFIAEKQNPRALHYNDILCIYEDYTGTIWLGTDGAGLSFYDEYLEKFNSFINYQTPENINIDVVRAITVDKEKRVWIGTSGKGLTQFDPLSNSWQTFTTNANSINNIASNRVMSLLVDGQNNLWIGTQGEGLNIYDSKEEFIHYSEDTAIPLSAETIWTIFEDSENRIWLGTREKGLIQFDKSKGEVKYLKGQVLHRNNLPGNNIRVITEGKKGQLWLGTETDGIVLFDTEQESFISFNEINDTNSLSNNNIKSLYYSPDNVLWIGTNGGGLNALDLNSKKFFHFTVEDGLANDVIYAIMPDSNGNLWLSSNKGITRFTKGSNLEASPVIVNYTNYDGLATEFNTGAYYKDLDGNLYFGGLDGFYWFKPNEIKVNSILPKTSITSLEVLNEPYPMKKGLTLGHTQNTLSFTFSSMQYALPEKNNYQYKLANYDEDWVYAGNNNFARYSYLPSGDYELLVKSSNYDGIWNETPARFAFKIAFPWYWNPVAKLIYFFLFLWAMYGVYSYFKWRWKMKLDLELKDEEASRLKKLNDFKSKLYTDISHEFRTPLTLISGPVDAKLSEGSLSDRDFESFTMIKRNTNRLLTLVDQLLNMAKLEKGKLSLKVKEGNLGLFIGAIASSFKLRAAQKNIDYQIKVDKLQDCMYDEDAMEKILTNLLTNALKYCPEEGLCEFNAQRENSTVVISVKNTVENLSEIEVDRLFTRFYQKDEYAEGIGVGLSLVKELVNLYRGEVSVRIEDHNMIHFRVILPLERELFESIEILNTTEVNEKLTGPADRVGLNKASNALSNRTKEKLSLVLIVEDHKEIRDFLKSAWDKKYQLYEAENGKLGIEKALEIIPDLIITDVRMPILDGIELCNTLKTDERTSHIPIILLTAGQGEENELKGLQSGADDFITKPFKLKILEKRVENLIESRKALRSLYSQEVILKAKDIAITPTDEIFLNKVQHLLDEQLSNPDFNAAAFSRNVGMSRMQLHRKLLAYSGLSTTAFIRSQRLKQAIHILQTSDASINEVAYSVGFNTPSYFIKCFKETFAKTPSEYLQTTNK
ncbi:two-component regulator propeller domain-containing protein [uncultured Eudoraea sp.]|uniref:hybrid sensor histidine kinase/response regulator transcription factor n=1 Tax=uncultured Eudoraea sp. TaxID=1035614 RepID=UPI00261A4316|nr:two-component regulator propeller domain-containing protein [uncultured Eudoraea sp.]